MNINQKITLLALFSTLSTGSLSSCETDAPTPATPAPPTTPITPVTAIPDELVGTWFAKDNRQPLTTYWNQGTVLGELGFRDFRTMVFTKDGQNAVEYSTFSVDLGNGQTRQRFCKFTGTLEYKANATPRSLTFHARSGVMRVYSPGAATYQESPITAADVAAHRTVWQNPSATTFPGSTNYLTCQRLDGSIPVSAEYEKVNPNAPATPPLPTLTPPTSGTYVKIGDLYYPTATIGGLEWTTMNYGGPGGLKNDELKQNKLYYGTFIKQADLGLVPVPAGWRIPTRRDFEKLLATQGVALEPWDMSPDDQPTTRALGPLMATTDWRRVDPWATNATGFNALPNNVLTVAANPAGEGQNCILWTSDQDANGRNLAFKLIQMTSTTYASILPFAPGTASTEVHIPVRLVRDK